MRITIKPPSPAPSPPLPAGALLTVRVEAADPAPRIDGPVSIAYEGRFNPTPAPGAFLFPAPQEGRGVSTRTSAHNPFRLPLATEATPYVDIPLAPGDVVTAVLTTPPPDGKTYSAAYRATGGETAPVDLTLVEGGGMTETSPIILGNPISPERRPGALGVPYPSTDVRLVDPDDPDVLTLDPAPGNDTIVVEN